MDDDKDGLIEASESRDVQNSKYFFFIQKKYFSSLFMKN
jgi:hypothetical protein